MRFIHLGKRNYKEVLRDPLALGLTIGVPVLMLVVLNALSGVDDFFEATTLAPGVAVFGFVMLMFSAAMTISRDRESALFSRLLTSPLTPNDFVAAYSLPYLPIAATQAFLIFLIGAFFGLEIAGSVLLVLLVLGLTAVLFIALGMILGALFSEKQVPFVYMAILMLVIFGGAWMDIESIGGGFKTVGDLLPFAHSLDAVRDVMTDGAGLSTIATDLYWLIGYTAVCVAGAVASFRHLMLER